MADFEYVSINTTAEKIEKIANMDIDDVTLDENSKDNSLPTSKLVFNAIKKEVENKFVPITQNAESYPYVYVQQDYEHGGTPSVLGADRTDGYMEAQSENGGLSDGDLSEFGGFIARRKRSGNLLSGTPKTKHDVANKMYVDALVGDIESLLGGI